MADKSITTTDEANMSGDKMEEKEKGRHKEIVIYRVIFWRLYSYYLTFLVTVIICYHNLVVPGKSLKDSRHASSGSYSLRDNASGSEDDDCDDEEEQVQNQLNEILASVYWHSTIKGARFYDILLILQNLS